MVQRLGKAIMALSMVQEDIFLHGDELPDSTVTLLSIAVKSVTKLQRSLRRRLASNNKL